MEQPLLAKGSTGRPLDIESSARSSGWVGFASLLGGNSRRGSPELGPVSAPTHSVAATLPATVRQLVRRAKALETIESYSFRPSDSAVHDLAVQQETKCSYRCRTATRWLFNLAIAVVVGLTAVGIAYCSRALVHWRLEALTSLISTEQEHGLPFGVALLGYLAVCCGMLLAAAVLTAYFAPEAAGSGISEVKVVLGGTALPRVLRLRTLTIKVVGLVLAVSAGLAAGREGPLIFAGAAIAAGLSQGKSTTLGWSTRWTIFSGFRNDREKIQNFVAAGAAAGVAAAFSAPIGGAMFVLEEGASFLSRNLLWRSFFTAIATAWTLQLMMSGISGAWGTMGISGLFSFGLFSHESDAQAWQAWELPFFCMLGAIGGIVGALVVAIQRRLTLFRSAYIPGSKPLRRVCEAVGVLAFMTMAQFMLAYWVGKCTPIPPDAAGGNATLFGSFSGGASAATAAGATSGVGGAAGQSPAPSPVPLASAGDIPTPSPHQPFYCPAGTYNELASMFLLPGEQVIRLLFHYTGSVDVPTLAVFAVAYFVALVVSFGIAVPAGALQRVDLTLVRTPDSLLLSC